jgi:hypothetical protein
LVSISSKEGIVGKAFAIARTGAVAKYSSSINNHGRLSDNDASLCDNVASLSHNEASLYDNEASSSHNDASLCHNCAPLRKRDGRFGEKWDGLAEKCDIKNMIDHNHRRL